MKTSCTYVCSRCLNRSNQPRKCQNCKITMEIVCRICGNAETNCRFVNCPGCKPRKPTAQKHKRGKK